ncbi:MAG: META domain-containing protein [Marmoricola sp.]
MTLKRALMVLVLTALAALSGCGDNGGRRDLKASVDPGLGPVTYVVSGVTVDGKPHPLVDGTEVRIRFADARVTLSAGCNTMSGTYQLEESRLTVADLATTDMGCPQARAEQDSWLAGLFAKPVQLTTGDEPAIVSGSTVLTMADREKVSPDKPLVGTRWTLDTLIQDEVASSLPARAAGTLTFTSPTGFSANVPCGTSPSGTYTLDGDRISFESTGAGIADCFGTNPDIEGDNGAVTRAFDQVLGANATWSIEENRLTITRDGHGLGFTAAD